MEIFALGNEGLHLPVRAELKGGKVNRQGRLKNWVLPLGVLAILVLAYFVWQLNSGNALNSNQGSLSPSMLEKRIAVFVFENQTTDPELDMFGKMISDWITRGLMETGRRM